LVCAASSASCGGWRPVHSLGRQHADVYSQCRATKGTHRHQALGECFRRADSVSITIVLDPDEEGYRLGFGDREGLQQLQKLARDNHIGLRSQPGLRIGLLLADEDVLVWSPTPKAVEGQRAAQQPNGVDLGSAVAFASGTRSVNKDPVDRIKDTGPTAAAGCLADIIRNAVGADDSNVLLAEAEIGRTPFTPEQVAAYESAP
jgi:hypothetical protein